MIGDKIKEKRQSIIVNGEPMTRYKLAKDSKVAYSFVCAIEDNKAPNASFVRIARICKVLGLSLNELAKEVK